MIGWPQQRSSGDSGQRPGIFGRERLLRREAVFAAEAQRTKGHTEMVAKPARKSVAIDVPPSAQSLDVSGPRDAFLEATRQSSVRVPKSACGPAAALQPKTQARRVTG